jgi:hypothetical protein
MKEGEHIFGSPLAFFENIIGIASDTVKVVIDENGQLIQGWLKWIRSKKEAHYDLVTGRFI